ncbi:hypothetical protein Tco_0403159, partial [Tanacetum coccineum]
IYAVEIQEYQVVCTRPGIASADVDMLDGFDRILQTYVQHTVALLTTKSEYMTLTKAVKTAIWLKGFTEFEAELKTVAVIAVGALGKKSIPSPKFQHRLNLLSIGIG